VNKRDYMKFSAMLEVVPPRKNSAAMVAACRNWFLLHPRLAELEPNEAGLNVCRQYMHIELNREEGPRAHIMDRLYKRFSNLRREMETHAMAALIPEGYGVSEPEVEQ
jgi:hypothetical protein